MSKSDLQRLVLENHCSTNQKLDIYSEKDKRIDEDC